MSDKPVASSAWITRFEGAVLRKEIVLGSTLIRHQFRRSFEHVGRNVHMVSVFGRILLGEDKIHEAEAAIYKRLDEVVKAIERKVAASEVAVKDAGINEDSLASYNKPEIIVAEIVVPAQFRYLKILSLADSYVRNLFTLWLSGEVDDKEKSKAELDLKKLLRQIPSTTRKMRIYVQEKLNASEHEEAKKEAAALAATIKDDDDTDDEEDIATDATERKEKNNSKVADATTDSAATEPLPVAA